MTEFEEYRKLVIDKTLTNLFFTLQDGPYNYMPGIAPAFYFSTVMELDHQKKLRFGSDFIVEWNDEEPLITLTNENWELNKVFVFKDIKIVGLTKDEYEQLTFHLENGMTITHTINYGDQLFIQNPTINFNKGQENDLIINSPNSSLQKVLRMWWQKLIGLNKY